MKQFAIAALMTVFTTASASQAASRTPTELHGRAADALMLALAEAGSYLDCGMGKCRTTAADVTCAKSKSVEMPNPVCTLKVLNERGTETDRRIVGTLALNLTNVLIEAGTVTCGADSCEGSATSIDCLSATNPETGGSASHCTIL